MNAIKKLDEFYAIAGIWETLWDNFEKIMIDEYMIQFLMNLI